MSCCLDHYLQTVWLSCIAIASTLFGRIPGKWHINRNANPNRQLANLEAFIHHLKKLFFQIHPYLKSYFNQLMRGIFTSAYTTIINNDYYCNENYE